MDTSKTVGQIPCYYPVMLDLHDKLCVVIGGGMVAMRKAEGLLAAGAEVRVVSPDIQLCDESIDYGKIKWVKRDYRHGDLQGAALVFAATNDRNANQSIKDEARSLAIPVCMVDSRDGGDFILPAVVRRGPLVIAISTGGLMPSLASAIREELEGRFDEAYRHLVTLLGAERSKLIDQPDAKAKLKALQKVSTVLREDLLAMIRNGVESDSIEQELHRSVLANVEKDGDS